MKIAAVLTASALTLGSCGGGGCDTLQHSIDSGPVGSYVFEATCESLTVTVRNYDEGTRFFVYTDGAPPYHLDMDEGAHTFPIYVDDYGLTVVHPDGTQTDGPMTQNPCER